MQQHTGLLINEWPAVLGSDCVGVVIDVGTDCKKLKRGDYVFGCAPLGQNKFTPLQETFLVEEDVFFKKPSNLSIEEAATVGVGLLVCIHISLCTLPSCRLAVVVNHER
jgi:NADPH:quinone reductase-like Zn-dependent oxidoreductase